MVLPPLLKKSKSTLLSMPLKFARNTLRKIYLEEGIRIWKCIRYAIVKYDDKSMFHTFTTLYSDYLEYR